MKKIPLTRGKYALVDDEDFESLSQFKWRINSTPSGRMYAVKGYSKNSILMHRFILNLKDKLAIDHVNGNSLDNRRSNLRLATMGQNIINSKLYKTNTTGFRGVYKHKNKFYAMIGYNNKNIHLGSFDTPLEASKVYLKAAHHYFGRFHTPEFAAD